MFRKAVIAKSRASLMMQPMATQLTLTIRDAEGGTRTETVSPGTYYFGRDPGCQMVLASPSVSRRHAKIIFEDKEFSIEDLQSTGGTTVEGRALTRAEVFNYPQSFELGSVSVHVDLAGKGGTLSTATAGIPVPDDKEVKITLSLDVSERTALPMYGLADQVAARLDMLYDLPLQFAAELDLDKLYKLILTKVMELIPGARRGSLLIIDPAIGKLVLRASIPESAPAISRTLIKRAVHDQQGFIWGEDQQASEDMSMSMVSLGIRTGMYVPLLWKGQPVGVLSVDNPKQRNAFRNEDLQFMISVAHYAAAAVANQLLQDDIETNNRTLQHLLANFSPKIRLKLLEKSRAGKLQPGGEKSEVTILMSDLRGFTLTSAKLDSEVVVEMLNDYFSVLGNIIFQHDGTIDKFIGDAILAVFGSPEPDDQHALKAVRCAIDMQKAIAGINERRRAAHMPCCDLGIGVHTGEVLHGFIGAAERLEYTVIGDTVNKASRYCDGARAGEIAIGKATHYVVYDKVVTEATSISTKHEGDLEAWLVRSS
jgi:adenylate cyclase